MGLPLFILGKDGAVKDVSTRVAIGLGSNQGDRILALRRAMAGLRHLLDEVKVSRVYETAPMYVVDQPQFLNACCTGRTRLTARQLLSTLKDLERAAGRGIGGRRYGPRPLDLDLLLYGEAVIEASDLVVPHPRLAERPFVLAPLAELAPDWLVPTHANRETAPVRDLFAAAGTTGINITDYELA